MKISIITTSFNTEDYIEETIQSILSQKGDFELEYIITDGGSTDSTVKIIKKYDEKVTWISEKDKGQSDGINKGLRMATGDIIAYLNADDIYYPGTLHHVVTYFKENPKKHWVTGYCKIVDERSNVIPIRKLITLYKNFNIRRYSYRRLLIENCISQPSTFWTRTLMDDIGLFSENYSYSMDYEYWCRAGKKYSLGLIREYLSGFRLYDTSKTGGGFAKQVAEHHEITKNYTDDPIILALSNFSNSRKIWGNKLLGLVRS